LWLWSSAVGAPSISERQRQESAIHFLRKLIGDNPFLVDLRFLQRKVPQFVMIHLKVLV
jgi:hypothetical protein